MYSSDAVCCGRENERREPEIGHSASSARGSLPLAMVAESSTSTYSVQVQIPQIDIDWTAQIPRTGVPELPAYPGGGPGQHLTCCMSLKASSRLPDCPTAPH